jgi:DNA-binding response OmpR family regulator
LTLRLDEHIDCEAVCSLEEARSKLPDGYDLVILNGEQTDGLGMDFLPELRRLTAAPVMLVNPCAVPWKPGRDPNAEQSAAGPKAMTLGADAWMRMPCDLGELMTQSLKLMNDGNTKQTKNKRQGGS